MHWEIQTIHGMAVKDYYELSAMLRLQLPILLSFAFLRCLIGQMASFGVNRFVSQRLKTFCNPVKIATDKTLSFLHALLLGTAVWYIALSYSSWSTENSLRHPNASLVCTEYDNARVQGLLCASGLLALFTNSDAFTLGMALATFKGVADGSVTTPVLSAATWSASVGFHNTRPRCFFVGLLGSTTLYATWCYNDDRNQFRAHGATIAASFASLLVAARVFLAALRRASRGLKRCSTYVSAAQRVVYRRIVKRLRNTEVMREHPD